MEILTLVHVTARGDVREPDVWRPFPVHLAGAETRRDVWTRYGIGTLVLSGKKHYVMTCHHVVRDHREVEVTIAGIRYKMTALPSIAPYDFTVLEFADGADGAGGAGAGVTSGKRTRPRGLQLHVDKGKVLIETLRGDAAITLKARCQGWNLSHIGSELFPQIPVLEVDALDDVEETDYEGLSGSIVVSTKGRKVLGMISCYDNERKVFLLIPSHCLSVFLTMVLSGTPLRGICLKTRLCEFADSKDVVHYGHLVVGDYGIGYETSAGKLFHFEPRDMIEEVDDQRFDEQGFLPLAEIGVRVPLDTFLTLSPRDYHRVSYRRGDSGTPLEITFRLGVIAQRLKFHLDHPTETVRYGGLVFAEMSETLLKYYADLGIEIVGKVQEAYTEEFVSVDGARVVVVVNIDPGDRDRERAQERDRERARAKLIDQYTVLGLPLIREDLQQNQYSMATLSTVNGTRIVDLEDLREILTARKGDPIVTLRLDLSYKRSLTISFPSTTSEEVAIKIV